MSDQHARNHVFPKSPFEELSFCACFANAAAVVVVVPAPVVDAAVTSGSKFR